MLELRSEFLDHLRSGGTLLVASRQRASAVRLAYSAAMLAEGRELWVSPDVLPWSAWVERELDEARLRDERMPQRLTSNEDWLLWQEAINEACTGHEVLRPDGMIEPVRRAVGILDDYAIDLRSAPTAEVEVLKGAMRHFHRRCEELHVLGRASWRALVPWLRPSARLLVADATGIGPQRKDWLAQHGARFATAGAPSGSCSVFDFETTTQEADAAASWCATQFARDVNARLLVVVPRLNEVRHLWERAFSQRLNQTLIATGRDGSAQSMFAIEGGRALRSYRIVSAALQLIELASGSAGFDELSEVLRSVYLNVIARPSALQIDRWLRERNIASAQLTVLRSVLPLIREDQGEAAAAGATALIAALEVPGKRSSGTPAEWAQTWVALLQQCGWPGAAPLGSDEQQARMRFDDLLGEFASVQVPAQRLTLHEATVRLQGMVERAAFEPASDDVPVTLTARLEDPLVRYDGIWVAGLSSEVWPPPAMPDPLLPLSLQYSTGIPAATTEGQSRLARQLQERWRCLAGQCVLSWSRTHEDLPHDRSPLLPLNDEPAREPEVPTLEAWYAARAPELENWTDRTTPAHPIDGVLHGGTRLLELQSVCPFRAFAELRLQAQPLEHPSPGINPRVRGMILHLALELFWNEMRDQATLRAKRAAGTEVQDLIHHSIARALRETLAREPGSVSEPMKQREHARTVRLINQMLEWEQQRPIFSTTTIEAARRHEFAGAAIDLRFDRVDVLEDGLRLILDYKTGSPKTFDGLADRLRQPQLPAYAIAAGQPIAGVAALYLGREGVKVRGSADQPSRFKRSIAPKSGELSWPERVERWRGQLQVLIDEYLGGDASVSPLPDVCKLCHLHALCRIDPTALVVLDTDPDNPEGEESEEESEEEGE